MCVLLSRMKYFKAFCERLHGRFLKKFFRHARLFWLFKTKGNVHKNIYKLAQREDKIGNLIIDFISLFVCKNIRSNCHKIFHEMAGLIHSSTDVSFQVKQHFILNEEKKIVFFVIKPMNLQDVSVSKEVLESCKGMVI